MAVQCRGSTSPRHTAGPGREPVRWSRANVTPADTSHSSVGALGAEPRETLEALRSQTPAASPVGCRPRKRGKELPQGGGSCVHGRFRLSGSAGRAGTSPWGSSGWMFSTRGLKGLSTPWASVLL